MGSLRSLGLFLFKYILCAFSAIFGIFFFTFTTFNEVSVRPASSYDILWLTSLFSLIFWFFYFFIVGLTKITGALIAYDISKRHEEEHAQRINIRISIKTKMELKPYLLMLSFSMFFIFLAMLVKSYQKSSSILTNLPLLEQQVFICSYLSALILLGTSLYMCRPEDVAIFHLDRFFRSIDLCKTNPRIRLGLTDFEEALKSYQKTLPSFYTLKNLKEIVAKTQLVLSRGTSEEINQMQMLIYSLSNSIKTQDKPLFDKNFCGIERISSQNRSNEEGYYSVQYLKERCTTEFD